MNQWLKYSAAPEWWFRPISPEIGRIRPNSREIGRRAKAKSADFARFRPNSPEIGRNRKKVVRLNFVLIWQIFVLNYFFLIFFKENVSPKFRPFSLHFALKFRSKRAKSPEIARNRPISGEIGRKKLLLLINIKIVHPTTF